MADFWGNRIGRAASATTGPDGIPRYGVAFNVGTTPLWDSDTFNEFVQDRIEKQNAQLVAQAELQKYREELLARYGKDRDDSDETWFNRVKNALTSGFKQAVNRPVTLIPVAGNYLNATDAFDWTHGSYEDFEDDFLAMGIDRELWDQFSEASQEELLGAARLGQLASMPIVREILGAFEAFDTYLIQPVETWLLMYRTAAHHGLGKYFDQSEWAKAWRAAEERGLGQVLLDTWAYGWMPDEDLDRLRRTSSLYQMQAFGADLAAGFITDPTVVAGKAVGALRAVAKGALPEAGPARAAALQVLRAEDPTTVEKPKPSSFRARMGYWRGQRAIRSFEELREVALNSDLADFANLPMFRRDATNGGALAVAFHKAARDDDLWNLTRRAAFADPAAWHEIRRLKMGEQPILGDYQGSNPATWLDALEAAKTIERRLESEINDLQKQIRRRDRRAPRPAVNRPGDDNMGMFRHYTWELDRDLEDKLRDLADVQDRLRKYEDYQAWLQNVPDISDTSGLTVAAELNRVSAKQRRVFNVLHDKNYKSSQFGPSHSIRRITRSAWLSQAQVVDLHRVDSGTENILRYFESLYDQLNYVDRDALNATLDAYAKAPNEFRRFEILREFEDTVAVRALSQYFNINEDAVRDLMKKIREKREEYNQAILGSGSIYDTAGNILDADNVQVVERKGGYVTVNVVKGENHVETYHLPEDMLQSQMPVSPTQTPNYYAPINIRELRILIERDWEFWKTYDSQWRNNARMAQASALDFIDKAGTAWNRLWKPAQLLRPAWPIRVLMDEAIRGLVMLGVSRWSREYGEAFAKASVNAINPRLHGPLAWRRDRREFLKAGPGPVTDRQYGRRVNYMEHDEELKNSPTVPESFAPRPSRKRAAALDQVIAANVDAWRVNTRRRAFVKEGVDPELAGPEQAYAWEKPIKQMMRRKVTVFDPASGRMSANGIFVPVKSHRPAAFTPDNLAFFVEQNRDLLINQGYRVMVRNGEFHIVARFNRTDRKRAEQFAVHVEASHLYDGEKGKFIPHSVEEVDELAEAIAKGELDADAVDRAMGLADDPDFDPANWDDPAQEKAREFLRRREFGHRKFKVTGPDGKSYEFSGAFEGAGEIYVPLSSSTPVYQKLTDSYRRTLQVYRRRAVDYKRLQPPPIDDLSTKGAYEAAKEYYTGWADFLNRHVRNDPIWFRMLQGESDQKIVHWLKNRPEGAKVRATLPHKARNVEWWVEEHRYRLNRYLPDENMQALLAQRKITPTELKDRIPVEDRPDISAEDLELANGTGIGALYASVVEKAYKALGAVPLDVLNRQPFFSGMYKAKISDLVANHPADTPLTQEVIDAYSKLAREFALKQVRTVMYDLMDESNLTQMLRFMAPFWGATAEAIEKWFKIMVEKPETIARFYVGQQAVYDHFKVVDENGEEQQSEPSGWLHYSPDHRIVIQIPDWLKKAPFFKKLIAHHGEVDFNIGSLNTVFQGENPLLPGLGPIVALTVDEYLNHFDETQGTRWSDNWWYKWVFPVGRPEGSLGEKVTDQLMAGWSRRMAAIFEGMDNRMYNAAFWQIMREMAYENQQKGLPPPTDAEVRKHTDAHMWLRVFASGFLPVGLTYHPNNQFFIDEFHKMQREFGPERGWEEFIKTYPDAGYYATPTSEGLVPATVRGMEDWAKFKDIIAKKPHTAAMLMSQEAYQDDFSYDIWAKQWDMELGEGNPASLRDEPSLQLGEFRADGLEARMARADIKKGWFQYRQFNSALMAELHARGLTSITSRGAEDLQQAKWQFLQLMQEENPWWVRSYKTHSDTIYSRVDDIAELARHPELDDRPDWLGVRQYLVIRQQATDFLDSRGAAGGSRNMQAQENADIAHWFYNEVGRLILDNPLFGEFYLRWLDSDTLERGSGP